MAAPLTQAIHPTLTLRVQTWGFLQDKLKARVFLPELDKPSKSRWKKAISEEDVTRTKLAVYQLQYAN
ncbi:MAG: hypothetical protein F6K58_13895 [Symploca sp. SIO2E9]|nr:hypothetical protein [Symploca sp. SIO2E9]